MLRRRGTTLKKLVREADTFAKLPSDYKEYTGLGGVMSILMFGCVVWLVFSEITYYLEPHVTNRFIPDVDIEDTLEINLDMTVAMGCNDIGADIIDMTDQDAIDFGTFSKEDTGFQLTPKQQAYFDDIQRLNSYLRGKYHKLRDIIWKSGVPSYYSGLPKREYEPQKLDACRIYGTIDLNKVAGNFHVTAGQSLHLPGGHIHLSQLFGMADSNFSHRVDRLSFGQPSPGIIHPLESNIKISNSSNDVYRYYIQVVPTITPDGRKTYQYSVKELAQRSGQGSKSNSMPGIFFKYEMHPLTVVMTDDHDTLMELVLRICGCVGGLYILIGIVKHSFESLISTRVQRIIAMKNDEISANDEHL